jgi:RNA ligase (TIGR02306 family)
MESIPDPSDTLFKHRKLASVQKITNLSPLGAKCQEELATVLGWKVFVPANQFKVGEKIIYFEIDSILPGNKKWTKKIKPKHLHVKTASRYNEISQGLIMKLDTLLKAENFANLKKNIEDLEEGFDLTEILEIKKFDENSEEGQKELEKKFPTELIEKSDEIRVQSNLNYIQLFTGKEFYSSLKYDGSSATYLIEPNTNKFRVCSRNMGLNESEKNIYNDIAIKYDIKNKLLKYDGKYAIQGEVYGPKVNGNPLKAKELTIAVFTIKNIKDNIYLGYDEMVKLCKEMDLPFVEVIEEGIFNYKSVEELIAKSKGNYPGTDGPREGLVYRLKNDWNKDGKRLSFKVINDDYLIKNKKK